MDCSLPAAVKEESMILREERDLPLLNRNQSSYIGCCQTSVTQLPPSRSEAIEDPQAIMELPLGMDRRPSSLCPAFMKSGSRGEDVVGSAASAFGIVPRMNSIPEIEMSGNSPTERPHTPAFAAGTAEIVLLPPVSEQSKKDTEQMSSEQDASEDNKSLEQLPEKKKKAGRKSNFTPENNQRILELVKIYGENDWKTIAEHMPQFNRKQLREHYVNFLQRKVCPADFTEEEDKRILQLVTTLGRKWQTIAKEFPGRTGLMIKNRYRTKLKAKMEPEGSEEVKSGSRHGTGSMVLLEKAESLPPGAKRAWDGSIIFPETMHKQISTESCTKSVYEVTAAGELRQSKFQNLQRMDSFGS